MKKVIIAITILVLITVYFGNAKFSFAEVGDYITNYQYYQENQFAKFRFKALQDFKISWEKVENDMIYFRPALSDIYYWEVDTDLGIYGSGGFLETTNELDDLPVGIFEKQFYKGQTYKVFLTGWKCGYNGCVSDEFAIGNEMNEAHSIIITDKIADETGRETIYFSEKKAPAVAKDVAADETGLDENNPLTKNKSGGIIVLSSILIIGLIIVFLVIKKKSKKRV